MAKTIKEERLLIQLELTREGSTGPIEVSCTANYEVSSENVTETRSFSPELTTAQKGIIRGFSANVLERIKQGEGI